MWIAVPILMPPCPVSPEMGLSHSPHQAGSVRTVSDSQQPQNNDFVSAKWASALLSAYLELCCHRLGSAQCFILPRDTALHSIHHPSSSESPLWYNSRRNQAGQISLWENYQLTERGGSWARPLWEWKERATALPLETLTQSTASKERELWSCKKEGTVFFYLSLRNGSYEMWLRHTKHNAGWRITKQELPAWTIGT